MSDDHIHSLGHGPGPGDRAHQRHAHVHGLRRDADQRRLSIALGLISVFMALEVVVACVAGSLALLADAGHMLVDSGAVAGAIWASRLARRPPSKTWSFGLKRAEILAAAVNGVTLLVVGVLVFVEAVGRLVHPVPVKGAAMVAVAVVGVAVNVAATWVLSKANRSSLNVEGVFQHILTDLYAFIGTVLAGVIIITTGWNRADPIASLFVMVLILRAAWSLLRASGRVLLEGTPESVDLDEVRRHLGELPGVLAVHDLHAWMLTSDLPALTAHIVVTDACINDGTLSGVLDHLQSCLSNHFDVEHSTFQLEAATHADHEPGAHE